MSWPLLLVLGSAVNDVGWGGEKVQRALFLVIVAVILITGCNPGGEASEQTDHAEMRELELRIERLERKWCYQANQDFWSGVKHNEKCDNDPAFREEILQEVLPELGTP